MQTCYLEYFEHLLSSPYMIVSPCNKIWCLSECKKSASTFFEKLWRHSKLVTLELSEGLTIPKKILASICRKLSSYYTWKKINFITNPFLTYCKKIANLLFWVIWACLATHIKWQYQFKKSLMFICRQKFDFVLQVFLRILQRYWKFVFFFFALWTCVDNSSLKWYYQFVENFCFYLQEKN